MTFAQRETSRDRGEPVELYFSRFGAEPDSYHAYTDAETPIVFDGVTYEPVPIERGGIKASGTLDKQKIEIRMPKNLGLPERFRIWPPSRPIGFILRQGHIGDTEFLVVATGRILSVTRERSIAKLTCEPIQTAMRRSGLRQNWQYGCPHVLYGDRCRADKNAAKHTVALLSVTPTQIVIPDGAIEQNKQFRFVNGVVEWEGPDNREARMILEVPLPGRFALAGSTAGLEPGMSVDIFYGCARTLDHCELFNNVLNFGGDPWIPFKNPVGVNPHW